MAESNGGFSLDDILNDIKREREIKAGIAGDDTEAREQTDSGENPENNPSAEPERTGDSLQDLLGEYLTDEERSASEDTAEDEDEPRENDVESDVEGQIKLDGYSETDPETVPSIVSEREAEKELIDRRKKRIDEFRVFASGISDEALLEIEENEEKRGRKRAEIFDRIELKKGEGLFDAVDGMDGKKKKKKTAGKFVITRNPTRTADERSRAQQGEKNSFNAKAQKKLIEEMKAKASFTSLISGIITAVLIFLAALPHFYTEGGALETLVGGSGRIYLGMNLALILLAILISYDTIRSSLKSLIRLTPNSDTVVLIALFFTGLHNIALLIKGGFMDNGGIIYNCAASFSLFVNSVTKMFVARRMEINLKTLMKNQPLRSVQAIENKADANQLAYGISTNGNPEILYTTQTDIPECFSALSTDTRSEERYFFYAVPVIIVVSIIAGIIGAFPANGIFGFITGFTGCICICLPVTVTFISNYLILRGNSGICKDGSAILGYSGISYIEETNAFIMDSRDIFYGEVLNFHTVRSSSIINEETAVTYAGAVLIKGGCVLSDVFAQIIKQQNIMLPAVEDLKYEDRLGFSAWINEVKVLVGNRDMMTQHNVQLPPLTDVEKKGNAALGTLYVAVEEKLAAVFNVRYLMGKNVAKQVRRLTDNGVVLMLMTRDPGITEEFVSAYAKINSSSIKITNSKSYDIMRLYDGSHPRRTESGLICKNSPGTILRLINAAFRLVNADRQASTIQMISLICAAVLSIGYYLIAGHSFLSPVAVIIYQILWGIASCFVSEKTLEKK